LPRDALDKDDGQEDRHRRQRAGNDGAAHFAHAADRRIGKAVAFFATARDRLEHDDRGVHEHAHAQRESAERHDVEGHAREVQWGEGDDQRGGDRDRNQQRGPRPAQEEEDHEDREETAEQARALDLVDRVLDVVGRVGEDAGLDAVWEAMRGEVGHALVHDPLHLIAALHLPAFALLVAAGVGLGLRGLGLRLGFPLGRGLGRRLGLLGSPGEARDVGLLLRRAEQARAHGLAQVDEVGARFLEDLDEHCGRPVDARDDLLLLRLPTDLGDLAQVDVRVAPPRDDDLADLVDLAELVERAHEVLGLSLLEDAGGGIEVLGAELLRDLANVEPERGHAHRVDRDQDLLLVAAFDLDGGHAFDLGQLAFEHVLRDVA
jgi:hypothetical protein